MGIKEARGFSLFLAFWLTAFPLASHSDINNGIHRLDYQGFTVWFDCKRRGAVKFKYIASKDTGNLPRRHSFTIDPDFTTSCQQVSSGTYKPPEGIGGYDRGHLVPANHLDHLPEGIHQSNFMTNILPQTKTLNRGAWLQSEEIIECARDKEDLTVIGGVIWGRNPDDDYFTESHGVATPDYFWKVVIAKDRVIAWLFPNSHQAKRKQLDKYLISIHDLEHFIGESIDVDDSLKDQVPARSWSIPDGCDKG